MKEQHFYEQKIATIKGELDTNDVQLRCFKREKAELEERLSAAGLSKQITQQ